MQFDKDLSDTLSILAGGSHQLLAVCAQKRAARDKNQTFAQNMKVQSQIFMVNARQTYMLCIVPSNHQIRQ